MEALKVYTKRLLGDMKKCISSFSDVELVCGDQKIITNSLVIASLSETLSNALKDLIYENLEERVKVIIPESDVDSDVLSKFFDDILFNTNEDLYLDENFKDVLDYLDIKFKPIKKTISRQIVKFSCRICDKSFSLKKLLARHNRTFHSDNPNKCALCGKLCRNPSEMRIHLRVHTKERPYKCSHCPKTYTQMSHLNEHLNSLHFGKEDIIEAQNICEICGLIFSSKSAVKKHKKIHPAIEPSEPIIQIEEPYPKETIEENETDQKIDNDPTIFEDETDSKKNPLTQKLVCEIKGCGKTLKTYSSFKLHIK